MANLLRASIAYAVTYFGRLINLARAEPVAVAKHGRPVAVVMAVEEFERLKALDTAAPAE